MKVPSVVHTYCITLLNDFLRSYCDLRKIFPEIFFRLEMTYFAPDGYSRAFSRDRLREAITDRGPARMKSFALRLPEML